MIFLFSCSTDPDKKILNAVNDQLKNYPESTLVDVYKNFFQDYYGPGHMLENPSDALVFLRLELKFVRGKSQVDLVEPTGSEGKFVRVDLSVITDGIVDYDEFAAAFVQSADYFREPEIVKWKSEWNHILTIIEDNGILIEGYEKDKKFLDQLLDSGEYVVHHSKKYMKYYNPHYRIIYKEIFDKQLLSSFE